MDPGARQAMDAFFRDVEQKAYLMAFALTNSRQDALELVQDSMLKLVQKYARRDPDEWGGLFHRILQNRIRDWYRRQKFRQALRSVFPWQDHAEDAVTNERSAEQEASASSEVDRVLAALHQLPLRQQQTFLLRAWQEYSTRETAAALAISENSVKTHYARATRQLRVLLGDSDG